MSRRLRREALWLIALGAASATALDVVLLQIRRSYFTGGFLSRDSATNWPDRLLFVLASLSVDVTVATLGVLLAMVVASRVRFGRVARLALAAACATGPLLIASVIEYQVFAHLGDAFDLGLMFDLVGRRPMEVLAVMSGHALFPVLGMVAAGGAVLAGVWRLNRLYPEGAERVGVGRVTASWLALALMVAIATTTMRTRSDVLDNGLRRKPAGQAFGALVTTLSDFDGDGFGMLSRPADPAPFDPAVYPYAIDIPGNGVDEDGVGGDLPLQDAPTVEAAVASFARTPAVVLVMLETFRADLLGAREGGREVTPVLNALARKGASSSRAYSHNGYTVQSKYHLFTGRMARQGTPGTLLDDFRTNGYEIAYFSGQDESFGGPAAGIGAEQADVFYDARQDKQRRYTTFTTAGSLGVSSDVVLERIEAFLTRRDRARPLFLFANFYDTHFPYDHRRIETIVSDVRLSQGEIVPARAAELRRMYLNTAANVDRAVGRLVERVTAHLGEAPVTVILADHGESLFDEGYLGHGYTLNEVQTRIPLVVSGAPLQLCEPLGQSDLRAALTSALASREGGTRPTIRDCGQRRVFQYLGTLDTPRQIAFVSGRGRITYDVREALARIDDGPWLTTDQLSQTERLEMDALVHFWERLRLHDAQPGGPPK